MIAFFAAGTPIPQGSKTAIVRNGRAVVLEGRTNTGRARFHAWRATVHAAACAAYGTANPIDAPVAVDLAFGMPRPASSRRAWPAVRPDLDKLTRAVLDSLTGAVIVDDARIVTLTATKTYSPQPGVTVTITPADEEPAR